MSAWPTTPSSPSTPTLRRELRGELRDVSLAVILHAVRERRLTGDLEFRRGDDHIALQIQEGEILFANSNDPATRLGEWLLMRGKITVAQYEESVKRLKATGQRQGTILLQMGCIPPLELEAAVRQQVRDIVLGLFQWTSGQYRFVPQNLPAGIMKLDLSITELIIKGIGQMNNWPAIRQGLQPFSDVLVINRNFDLAEAKRVRLTQEEDAVLHLTDGKRTIAEMVSVSPFNEFATYRTLYAFKAARVLVRKT